MFVRGAVDVKRGNVFTVGISVISPVVRIDSVMRENAAPPFPRRFHSGLQRLGKKAFFYSPSFFASIEILGPQQERRLLVIKC